MSLWVALVLAAEPLTLQQAIDTAIAQHPALTQRRAQLVEATGIVSATRRRWAPTPTAGSTFGWSTTPVVGPLYSYFRPFDRAVGTTWASTLTLAGQIPVSSTRYSLGVTFTRSTTDRLDSLLGTTLEAVPTFELRQPLLRGGWGVPYGLELEARSRSLELAEARLLLEGQAIVLGVIDAFLEAWRAQQVLAIRQTAIESAENSVKIAQALLAGGRSIAENVDTAKAELARRQRDLIEAQVLQQRAQAALLAACYLDRTAGWTGQLPSLTSDALAVDPPPSEDALVEELDAHPRLREVELAATVARANLAFAQNNVLPDLSLTGRVGLLGQGGDPNCFGGVTRNGAPCGVSPQIGQGSFAGAASTLGSAAFPLAEAGAQFSVPLADTAAWSALASAEARVKETAVDREAVRTRLAWEARVRFREWTLATQRLQTATQVVDLAERTWAAVTRRFQVGNATAFDQLRSLEQVYFAREQALTAQIDLSRAAMRLEEIRPGRLIGRFVKEGLQ